jgi:predicted phage tail protein
MDPISIIGYIVGIGGGILALFSRIPKQTITNQKELIDTYEKRITALEQQKEEDHKTQLENVRAIADLQGQIKVYKELPLREMARAMQEISEVNKTIAESNTEILKTLRGSALIAAEDRLETHTETTKTVKKV